MAPRVGREHREVAPLGITALVVEPGVFRHPAPPLGHGVERRIVEALAADKVISMRYVLGNACRAPNIRACWSGRHAFLTLVPYFRAFLTATAPTLPEDLADELGGLVREARRALVLAAEVPAHRPHTVRRARLRPRNSTAARACGSGGRTATSGRRSD